MNKKIKSVFGRNIFLFGLIVVLVIVFFFLLFFDPLQSSLTGFGFKLIGSSSVALELDELRVSVGGVNILALNSQADVLRGKSKTLVFGYNVFGQNVGIVMVGSAKSLSYYAKIFPPLLEETCVDGIQIRVKLMLIAGDCFV